MSDYDQRDQRVQSQCNIAAESGGTMVRKILRDLRTNDNWGLKGSKAALEFRLDKEFALIYKRDELNTFAVCVDGSRVFRKQIFNPLGRINCEFQIEGIDCEFLVRKYFVGASVMILVAGHEIFSMSVSTEMI